MQHVPSTCKQYGASLKAAQSTSGPVFLGGNRGRMKAMQNVRLTTFNSPKTRTVQPKPTFPSS
jgi:hypothetical protein